MSKDKYYIYDGRFIVEKKYIVQINNYTYEGTYDWMEYTDYLGGGFYSVDRPDFDHKPEIVSEDEFEARILLEKL